MSQSLTFRQHVSRLPGVRRLGLRILRHFPLKDIRIRHHWTGMPMRAHVFRHKGYWFHGKKREQATIEAFYKIVKPGMVVCDIGGHIGYMTMIYSKLVGPEGRVFVFEPGDDNRDYLSRNCGELENVEIVPKAVSSESGTASFFVENLTGQNNSLIEDYVEFEKNRKFAYDQGGYAEISVDTVTLDDFFDSKVRPDFIKIDVEGAELLALSGMRRILSEFKPGLMIEVTKDERKVADFLVGFGYSAFKDDGSEFKKSDFIHGNSFWFPS